MNDFLPKRAKEIRLWSTRLCTLFYADDLILIAESREDLQSQMDGLGMYVKKIWMDINEKKTKVLVFRRLGVPKDNNLKSRFIGESLLMRWKGINT